MEAAVIVIAICLSLLVCCAIPALVALFRAVRSANNLMAQLESELVPTMQQLRCLIATVENAVPGRAGSENNHGATASLAGYMAILSTTAVKAAQLHNNLTLWLAGARAIAKYLGGRHNN